jgi:hypothetical protein
MSWRGLWRTVETRHAGDPWSRRWGPCGRGRQPTGGILSGRLNESGEETSGLLYPLKQLHHNLTNALVIHAVQVGSKFVRMHVAQVVHQQATVGAVEHTPPAGQDGLA